MAVHLEEPVRGSASAAGSQNGMKRFPWITALLALPAIVLAFSPALAAALQYERSAVATGEVWRLVTGHWVHWSTDHLLWDLLAFAGLGAFCELRSRWRFLACLALAAPVIGLGVHLFQPHLATYRGLSGLDSALYVLAAGSILAEAWRLRQPWLLAAAGLALILFGAKTLFELASGGAVFMRAEGLDVVVVPLAHLLGAAVVLPILATEGGRR